MTDEQILHCLQLVNALRSGEYRRTTGRDTFRSDTEWAFRGVAFELSNEGLWIKQPAGAHVSARWVYTWKGGDKRRLWYNKSPGTQHSPRLEKIVHLEYYGFTTMQWTKLKMMDEDDVPFSVFAQEIENYLENMRMP